MFPSFHFSRVSFLPWGIVSIIAGIACGSILMLYSAGNGSLMPWGIKQALHFLIGILCMGMVAMMDSKWWQEQAYVFYSISLFFLILVECVGWIGMGAQRWINVYFFQFQPSEMMKAALVLALGRYFHQMPYHFLNRPMALLIPVLMVFVPVAFVMRQPDLGTAMMLMGIGVTIFFAAGVAWYYFLGSSLLALASIPLLWHFLHDYQRNRILNFINPERDPLNTGYQILQSKIALGSGGFWGRGFLKGTQSHLNFLPAKQTDFIFTMLCEEWGMAGGLLLMILYGCLIIYGLSVVLRAKKFFDRLVVTGLTMTLFLYIVINISMVMGLVPVVGIPLPLVTYGGTSLLSLLLGFGIIFSIDISQRAKWAS